MKTSVRANLHSCLSSPLREVMTGKVCRVMELFSSCYTGSYLCDVTETLPHAPCIIQNMVSEHNGTSSCIRYHAVGAGTKQKVVVCLNYPHVALHRDPSSN